MCSRRSRSWRRDGACGARRSTRWRSARATAPGRCRPRSKARSGSRRSAPASRRRSARSRFRASAASIASRSRPRRRLRITCVSCGSRPRWTRCSPARPRSGGASSTGWCSRSMPSIPAASTRSNARCARATGCWKRRDPIRTGSTQSSMRPPRSRSRSRPGAPRRCGGCRAPSRRARISPHRSRGPKSRSTAGSRPCCSTIPRWKPRTAIARCCATAGRAMPRRGARSPARTSPTSK